MRVHVRAARRDLHWLDINIREDFAEGFAESSIVVHDHMALAGQESILTVSHVHRHLLHRLTTVTGRHTTGEMDSPSLQLQERKRYQGRMALPSFNIVFYLVALINSSLAILLGFFSIATTFGRRLLALGSTRSGRWPTVWLADVSNDN